MYRQCVVSQVVHLITGCSVLWSPDGWTTTGRRSSLRLTSTSESHLTLGIWRKSSSVVSLSQCLPPYPRRLAVRVAQSAAGADEELEDSEGEDEDDLLDDRTDESGANDGARGGGWFDRLTSKLRDITGKGRTLLLTNPVFLLAFCIPVGTCRVRVYPLSSFFRSPAPSNIGVIKLNSWEVDRSTQACTVGSCALARPAGAARTDLPLFRPLCASQG